MKPTIIALIGLVTLGLTSCNDFLDQEPLSSLSPESFYTDEGQVQAASNKLYQDIMPNHETWNYGYYSYDNGTDNQTNKNPGGRFAKDLWLVGNTNSSWSWGNVRNVNYQLNQVLTKYQAKQIAGTEANIRQVIGEMYFFRAYAYFELLKKFGDLPILTQALPDDESVLVAANMRQPRNEVARFIIANLDTAMTYLNPSNSDRTRVTPNAAKLFKSRVALYEGTWETNFKNTPFVPNGPGWPGKSKNPNYQYPTGSVEAEAKFFLQIAANSAEEIAEKYKGTLKVNNGVLPQHPGQSNPYMEIWGNNDGSKVPEIIMWRQYSKANGGNFVEIATEQDNKNTSFTRGLIDCFLMKDGKPTYNSEYEYCDTGVVSVRTNRDPRLTVFLKAPGDTNCFKNLTNTVATDYRPIEVVPMIWNDTQGGQCTGYNLRKGTMFDRSQCIRNESENILVIFRATEALLNYIEAEYMLTGNLSGKVLEYWQDVRRAAGFTGSAVNPQTTIDATDMTKETLDWGAYTAGHLLTDKTLYNIRRERRCEFIAEGLRDMDLKRWRSFDQLIEHPYHIEGFHLYNTPIEHWYDEIELVNDGSTSAFVSSPELSEYIRPHEVTKHNNSFYNGLTWMMAHYLEYVPLRQFLLTAPDHSTMADSPLYQNPYWPMEAGEPAQQ